MLDLGCGTGRQLLDLADCIDGGVGIDVSPAMIARAQDNAGETGPALRFRTGDAAAPGETGRFGLILFIGSLEHTADPTAALAAARRLLAARGRVVVIMPNPWNPLVRLARWTAPAGAPCSHLTPRQLARLAGQAGLELDSVTAMPYRPFGGAGRARPTRWPFPSPAYAALLA